MTIKLMRIPACAKALLLAACMLAAGGCASTQLTNVWRDPSYTGGPLKNILVMGVSQEAGVRRIFEDEFAAKLNSVGVHAVASYLLIPQDGPADRATLDAAIAKAGADGVLITRLLRVERHSQYAPGSVIAVPAVGYRRNFHGYYTSTWVQYAPPQRFDYDIVVLETNLWQPKKDRLVWSGTTESFAPSDVRQATREFADVIIKALREQKLI